MTGLVGTTAEVSVGIPQGGVGQVALEYGGERTSTSRGRRTARRSPGARRSSSPASAAIRSSWRRRGSPAAGGSQMSLFGVEFSARHGRARDPARAARPVRRDGAVRAQLHQGAAVDGRDLLRPQAHAHRREGQPHRRSASASCAAAPRCGCRCSSRSRTSRSTSSRSRCRIQRAYTKEGVAVTVEAVANVKIAGDDVSLRGAAERFLGHDRRADQGRHLPDARRPPARDPRHAHGRGDQRRPPGVRPEDDRRGGRRSEEDGRQHRHPDHPADQRRAGLPRRARQEAHGRGQARRRHRRGAGAARRDDQVGDGRPGRQDQALRGRRRDRAVAARQGDRGRPSSTPRSRPSRPRPSRPGRSPPPSRGRRSPSRKRASTRSASSRKCSSRSRRRRAGSRSCRRPSSSRPRPSGRRRSCAPKARSRRPSSAPRRRRRSSSSRAPARPRRSSGSAAPRPRRCWPIGEAEAEVIKKKLLAEAEGLQKKAEAWKNFNDAAVINMVVDKMPELAQAFATQLAGIDKINIIEMGNGAGGSGGVGKVMGTVGGGMTAMLVDAEGPVRHRRRAADAGQDRRGATAEAEKKAEQPLRCAAERRLREHAALGSRAARHDDHHVRRRPLVPPLPGVRARRT